MKKNKGKDAASGITLQNLDISFSKPFPATDCDPWLSNFQKILTDGDPDQTGVKKEVAFQAFVPNLVQLRGRVATGDLMKDLQPVRLDAPRRHARAPRHGNVRLHVLRAGRPQRHLARRHRRERQDASAPLAAVLRRRPRPGAEGHHRPGLQRARGRRIFDDENHRNRLENLLSHETVTEVGAANSPDAGNAPVETLGCDKGAQNVKGGSILDCVKNDTPQFTVKGPGFAKDGGTALPAGHPSLAGGTTVSDSGPRALGSALAFALVTPFGLWRLRRNRRRRPRE